MNTFESLRLVLVEKASVNSFLFYMLVEILQLVYEISSLAEVLYRKSVLKN